MGSLSRKKVITSVVEAFSARNKSLEMCLSDDLTINEHGGESDFTCMDDSIVNGRSSHKESAIWWSFNSVQHEENPDPKP